MKYYCQLLQTQTLQMVNHKQSKVNGKTVLNDFDSY